MVSPHNSDQALSSRAQEFAEELDGLLKAVVPESSTVTVEPHPSGEGFSVETGSPTKLTRSGQLILELSFSYWCSWSRHDGYIAIERSSIKLQKPAGGVPLMTFDYLRRPARVPASHINVSVLDPALSDLVKAPFDQSHADAPEHNSRKIHLPTGGPRFRPALEDVLEMAITEFNIDKHPSARAAIQHGRARFRARQLQTVVADDPETARTRLGELSEGHDPKPARLNAF